MYRNTMVFLAVGLCAVGAIAQTSTGGANSPATTDNPEAQKKAADAKKPATPKVSEDVVVSATREERSAADVPVSVTVIPAAQIQNTPATTIDDVLRSVPGLTMPLSNSSFTFPQSNRFSMRGAGATRALVLLDGEPLNDPFSGDINWNRVSLPMIQQIEIARGGAGSLFGNYAMSGLLDILTTDSTSQRLWAQAQYGSYNTSKIDVAYSQPLTGSLGLSVNADTFDTDGFQRMPANEIGTIDVPFAFRNRLVGLRLDGTLGEGIEAFLRGDYFKTHVSQGTRLAFDDKDGVNGSGGIRWKDAFGGDLSANAYVLHQEFDQQNTSLVPADGRNFEFISNQHRTPSQQVGGSIQWGTTLSQIVPLFAVGLDIKSALAEDRVGNYLRSGAISNIDRNGGTQTFGGLFAEVDLYPAPRLEVLASARLDIYTNADGHDFSSTSPDKMYPNKTTKELDPRLSIREDLGGGYAVRVAGYRGFGAPALNGLYSTISSKNSFTPPNPSLGPELLIGYEAGLEYDLEGTSVQLNIFENRVSDLISTVQIAATPIQLDERINVGEARSRGVELFGSRKLGARWRLDAAYTYTDAVVVDNPPDRTLEGKMIALVPRDFASGSISYTLASGWSATLRARYWTRTYKDATNLVPLDSGTVVDALLAIPFGRSFDVTLSGENILDRHYVSDNMSGSRIGAPAEYFVGIRFHPFPSSSSAPRGRD